MPPQSDQFAALSNLHSNVPSGTVLVKTNRALGLLVFASGFAVTAVSGGKGAAIAPGQGVVNGQVLSWSSWAFSAAVGGSFSGSLSSRRFRPRPGRG